MGEHEGGCLRDVLEVARDRAFVGRSEQLALFRAALSGDPVPALSTTCTV
ncbi:hypothetical protein AB0M05_44960 [Streptomyces violaceusniger]